MCFTGFNSDGIKEVVKSKMIELPSILIIPMVIYFYNIFFKMSRFIKIFHPVNNISEYYMELFSSYYCL